MARSNECAPKSVLILIFFQWRSRRQKISPPKLHQVSEKASMPTKKLITDVWSSIKRWRDQMISPQRVFPLQNFFSKKAFAKKSRPKITSSQRKSLNANAKAYYCRVVKHQINDYEIKWMLPNRCSHFEIFFKRGRRFNERWTNIKVSNTIDNWKA